MPSITIHVPEPHRAGLLREVLNLYAIKADALHHATTAYLTERGPGSRVLADQVELSAIEALAEQLGWRLDLPIHTAAVTGESYLLSEVARAVLRSAIESLCERYDDADPRPDKIVAAVPPALMDIRAAYGLVRQTYDAAVSAKPAARARRARGGH